jgi:MerR family transcriptional regulator, copper efflux regulator
MKIGELAAAADVSVDTLRYYEKQGLVAPPVRAPNGYRSYGPAHLERVLFVRSAQALGFTLTQIGAIIARLAQGQFGRADIEQQLQAKLVEIDAQIRRLQGLKRELRRTVDSLSCASDARLGAPAATLAAPGAPARVKRLHG